MVDIDDIINRLIEHPSKEVLYSISESRLLESRKEIKESDAKEDTCVFDDGKRSWEIARKTFMEKHPGVFPELPAHCSAKVWAPLVKESGLEKEWFEEFRLALAEDVTKFVQYFALKEVEAEPELYRAIKKELVVFEAKHYEKRYCDMVLFRLRTDYESLPMTILGNAGQTFGVSFYPSDPFGKNFNLIQNQDYLNIDSPTANAVSTMLSFYFEKDPSLYAFLKDPYVSHHRFTSAYMHLGTLMRSYLPKSIAIRALSYLKVANKKMASFARSKEGKLQDNTFYEVFLDREKADVFKTDPHEDFTGRLPYDLNDVAYIDPPLQFKKNGSFDAAIRCLPSYATGKEGDDERIMHFTLVGILCDHSSGYIHINSLGPADNYRPFDNLVKVLSKDLQKIVLPKTIYVNTYLDLLFFSAFFSPYIEKGKTKVELADGELKTDVAFDELINFLDQQVEEEEGFPEKEVAQA